MSLKFGKDSSKKKIVFILAIVFFISLGGVLILYPMLMRRNIVNKINKTLEEKKGEVYVKRIPYNNREDLALLKKLQSTGTLSTEETGKLTYAMESAVTSAICDNYWTLRRIRKYYNGIWLKHYVPSSYGKEVDIPKREVKIKTKLKIAKRINRQWVEQDIIATQSWKIHPESYEIERISGENDLWDWPNGPYLIPECVPSFYIDKEPEVKD